MAGDRDSRRRRREFIAQNHPDRGGDPVDFVHGLEQFEKAPESGPPANQVPEFTLDHLAELSPQPWPESLVTRVLRRLTGR
jgi:hypothetical protein